MTDDNSVTTNLRDGISTMIRVIAAGKIKDRRIGDLVADYLKRAGAMARIQVVEVRDSDPEREAREMVAKLGSAQGQEWVVALDEHGDDLTSRQLAQLLGRHGSISFIIGGADGLGPAVRQRADQTLRLSHMTLTHEMARLVLVEQVSRGLSILRGKPYHRD